MTNEEAKIFLQEVFTLSEFQLRLVSTLDHSRILVEDIANCECEIWQADPNGTLLLEGIKYSFSHDLVGNTTTNTLN
jgi:hypothetical protein